MNESPPAPSKFFAGIDGAAQGPFDKERLEGFLEEGKLKLDSLVWNEEMDDWQKLALVLDLQVPPLPQLNQEKPAQGRLVLAFVAIFLLGMTFGGLAIQYVGPALAQDPELPIYVTFRTSLMDQGLVARFQSFGKEPLHLKARFVNNKNKNKVDVVVSLAPGEQKEFGWMEGWQFESGETVFLEHDGYQPKKVLVP